jgi:hypothetical protein
VFLAVGSPVAGPSEDACGMCEGEPDDVGTLRPGVVAGVCANCFELASEIAREAGLDATQRETTDDFGRPCILCGTNRKRMLGGAKGGLCYACLETEF